MHTRINNSLWALAFVIAGTVGLAQNAWATCPPPANPSNCAQHCSIGTDNTEAMRDFDNDFVDKLKDIAKKIFDTIDKMDSMVAEAVQRNSAVATMAFRQSVAEIVKTKEAAAKAEQQFKQEEKTLEMLQISTPGELFKLQSNLKAYTPGMEVLTRAARQQLYEDQTLRTELVHESFYSNDSNKRERSYNQGTLAGMAKLYETHRRFYCNAAGANKPPGCGDSAAHEGVKMGDQMFEIYLGEDTWPKEQVQTAIELMQFYLGISPPDLPNTADFGTGKGQREYMEYQATLARNNFLTYILTYLASKRAPSNPGKTAVTSINKEAAGCGEITEANKEICDMYDKKIIASGGEASEAEMDRALTFSRFMNSGFSTKAVSDTLGLDKDMAVLLADRIQQDYEEYQMDKMITATLAGYYASLVEGKK